MGLQLPLNTSRSQPQAETGENKAKLCSCVLVRAPEIMLFRMLFPVSPPFHTFCLFLLQLTFFYSELLGYCQLFPSETPLQILLKTMLKAQAFLFLIRRNCKKVKWDSSISDVYQCECLTKPGVCWTA